jgi:hypothetical protein
MWRGGDALIVRWCGDLHGKSGRESTTTAAKPEERETKGRERIACFTIGEKTMTADTSQLAKKTEGEGGGRVLIGEKEAGWRLRHCRKRREWRGSAGATTLQQVASGDLTQARRRAGTGEAAGGPAHLQQYDFFISFKISN